jgi:3-hydroxymyristoyl/3-hydroxydecanoyl-(acyl carrier protein) dehydratase
MSLPLATIRELLPHRDPMIMVDELITSDGEVGHGRVVFPEDHYGVCEGRVLETAIVEALAQVAGAMRGDLMRQGKVDPCYGILVRVRRFNFHREPRCGEPVDLHISLINYVGPFVLVHAKAACHGEVVAEGDLHFYQDTQSANGNNGAG